MAVRDVSVNLALNGGQVWLEFAVASDGLLLPAFAKPGRSNELWKATCFELFVKPARETAYFEYNFSPSFEWAAYAFDGYRQGMHDLAFDIDPEIEVSPQAGEWFCLAAELNLPAAPGTPMAVGLSAVIEETDGTKSYWALAHPPGKPDFHDPACFALELPAPETP